MRIVWKKRREGLPGLACSKRIVDLSREAIAAEIQKVQSESETFDIDVVSATSACPRCQKVETAKREKVAAKQEREAVPAAEDPTMDWKTAQLPPGDR